MNNNRKADWRKGPRRRAYTVEHTSGVESVPFVAFRIAQKYTHRIPTPMELMDDWGMTRATAYRWVRVIKDARGVA